MNQSPQRNIPKGRLLELENLITINPFIITKNFQVITHHLEILNSLSSQFSEFLKWKSIITQEFDKLKVNSEKNYVEIKNLLRNQSKRRQTMDSFHKSSLSQNKQIFTQTAIDEKFKTQIRDIIPTMAKKQQINTFKQELKTVNEQYNTRINYLQKQMSEFRNEFMQLQKCEVGHSTQIELINNSLNDVQNTNKQFELTFAELRHSINQIEKMQYDIQIQNIKNQNSKKHQNIVNNLKKKVEYNDIYKLEQMIIGMIQYVNQQNQKKLSNKLQTKKALIYLQKRINRILCQLYGQQMQKNDPLFSGKSWCLSCHKDKFQKNKTPNANKSIKQKQNLLRPTSSKFSNPSTTMLSKPQTENKNIEMKNSINALQTNYMGFYGNIVQPKKVKMHFEYMNIFHGGIKQYSKLQKRS